MMKPSDVFRQTNELVRLVQPHNVDHAVQTNRPIPTNKWWGNLLAFDTEKANQSDAIFAHPYTHMMQSNGLSISYLHPYQVHGPLNDNDAIKYYYYPPSIRNLVVSAVEWKQRNPVFRLTDWDDLGVHVEWNGERGSMGSYLALGSAFTTIVYDNLHCLLQSDQAMVEVNGTAMIENVLVQDANNTFLIRLNNDQVWFARFFGVPNVQLQFTQQTLQTTVAFSGFVQYAFVPHDDVVSLYRTASGAHLQGASVQWEENEDDSFAFEWKIASSATGYLHFALEHQRQLLDLECVEPVPSLQLSSHTRGPMHAYRLKPGHIRWRLRMPTAVHQLANQCASFYPLGAEQFVPNAQFMEILRQEIYGDWQQAFPHDGSYYFKGKALQKFGSLCLLAKRLATDSSALASLAYDAIHKFKELLVQFTRNASAYPLVYDTLYKGIITSEALVKRDAHVDFGNAVYNDHHYHYGYVITAAAMAMFLDPDWATSTSDAAQVQSFVESLLADVVSPVETSWFPRFRHFDWFLGHSLSHGVTPMADGKDEESTSEEINGFYGMAMYAHVMNQHKRRSMAALLLQLNTIAINTYVLIHDDNQTHPPAFRPNKVAGIFFDNKCDYATWFSPHKECIHGIQMLPVTPMLYPAVRSVPFIQEEWQLLKELEIVTDWQTQSTSWTSLLFVNAASILEPEVVTNVLQSCPMDDGLSRAWALYSATCMHYHQQQHHASDQISSSAQYERLRTHWKTKFQSKPALVSQLNAVLGSPAVQRSLDEDVELLLQHLLQP